MPAKDDSRLSLYLPRAYRDRLMRLGPALAARGYAVTAANADGSTRYAAAGIVRALVEMVEAQVAREADADDYNASMRRWDEEMQRQHDEDEARKDGR